MRPTGPTTCRLIARSRTARPHGFGRVAALAASLVVDPTTFIMESGMLLGIKKRAEREQPAGSDGR